MEKGYLSAIVLLIFSVFSMTLNASACLDLRDSYSDYDNKVKRSDIRPLSSEYYLLSYSWAPRFCKKASKNSKKVGKRNYLQCNSGKQFGYILHGLWPQGKLNGEGGYPRACLGDQPKIAKKILAPYLCMTPSVWLLQHEYEYHGTCMAAADLRSPQGYLDKALELHQTLNFPNKELGNHKASFHWWYINNPALPDGAIKFANKSKEWQFCFDRDFSPMSCPSNERFKGLKPDTDDRRSVKGHIETIKTNATITDSQSLVSKKVVKGCFIKGNISKKNASKWYFLPSHPQYSQVKIDRQSGERCFDSEQQAKSAGWKKSR